VRHIDKDYVAKRSCYQVRSENIPCENSEFSLCRTSSADGLINLS